MILIFNEPTEWISRATECVLVLWEGWKRWNENCCRKTRILCATYQQMDTFSSGLTFFCFSRFAPFHSQCTAVCVFSREWTLFFYFPAPLRNVSIILSSPWSQLHAEHKHTARWKSKREYICWEFESPNKPHDDNNNNNRNWYYTKAEWKGRNEWQGKKWIGAKWIIPKQNVGRVEEEATERKTSVSFAPANQSDHKFIVLNCFCILKYTFGPNFFPDGFVRSLHLQELPSGTFPHSQHNTCAIVLTNFRSSVHRCRFFWTATHKKHSQKRKQVATLRTVAGSEKSKKWNLLFIRSVVCLISTKITKIMQNFSGWTECRAKERKKCRQHIGITTKSKNQFFANSKTREECGIREREKWSSDGESETEWN